MEWAAVLSFLFGGFFLLMAIGLPVAYAFLTVVLTGVMVHIGPVIGPTQFTLSLFDALANFSLVPVPLFIFMGELLYFSGLAMQTIDAVAKWLRGVPARLSVIATIGGALFGILSGSTMANTAMLGSFLVPEMERRGYKTPLSVGPIMASGGLAMIIPPSALTVIYATTADVSVGRLLIAGLIPGLLMAFNYTAYIVTRATLQPHLAPRYEVAPTPLREKLRSLIVDVLPMSTIVFAVTGVILFGMATPTESGAAGAFAALLLAAASRKLSLQVLIKSIAESIKVTGMTFLIMAGSVAYSQLLAYTGVTRSLIDTVVGSNLPAWVLFAAMMLIVLIMGAFVEQVAIIMLTVPLFMPITQSLGFDPIWWGILMLINLQIGMTSPPFGLLLFVMKGVAPKHITMKQLYMAALPFIGCDVVSMTLITIFPAIATWLPYLIKP